MLGGEVGAGIGETNVTCDYKPLAGKEDNESEKVSKRKEKLEQTSSNGLEYKTERDVGTGAWGSTENLVNGNSSSHSQSRGRSERARASRRLRERERLWSHSVMEITFHHMQVRKIGRQRNGTYEGDKPFITLWVFLTILLMFGALAPSFTNGNFEFDFHLNVREIGFISLCIPLIGIFLVYSLTRVVVIVRWSLYWLLLTETVLYFWKRELNLLSEKTPLVLLLGFLTAEVLTFSIYVLVHYFYPAFIQSRFFQDVIGTNTWWQIQHTGPWTLTYHSSIWWFPFGWGGRRNTCSYRGAVDSFGLPHGYGHWMDDNFHGEILTGWWEKGYPVGPFRSREYGSGFAFSTCMLGFVLANDDPLNETRFFTKQTKRPRVGVASVECSISGGFFSHLPSAKIVYGPYDLVPGKSEVENNERNTRDPMNTVTSCTSRLETHDDRKSASIAQCFSNIRHLSIEHPLSKVSITTNASNGLTVAGHVYRPTGEISTNECKQLIIDIIPGTVHEEQNKNKKQSVPKPIPTRNANSSFFHQSSSLPLEKTKWASEAAGEYASCDNNNSGDESQSSSGYDNAEFSTPPATPSLRSSLFLTDILDERQYRGSATGPLLEGKSNGSNVSRYGAVDGVDRKNNRVFTNVSAMSHGPITGGFGTSSGHFQPFDQGNVQSAPHLRVNGWKSSVDGHVEALIFFPGFNASLEVCLNRLGQFMTIGNFPAYIKPIVFCNIGGKISTYLSAVATAASEKTQASLHELLEGLLDSGIENVHLFTHSMGVQTLMAAFADREDGEPSPVARLFLQAGEDRNINATAEQEQDTFGVGKGKRKKYLRARTITILNGDYPLSSFVNHGFGTLRRVCDVITVVGNRKDAALLWSELGNGVMLSLDHYLGGKSQPDHMRLRPEYEEEYEDEEDPYRIPACSTDRDSYCCCSFCCCKKRRTNDEIQGKDRLFSMQMTMGKQIFCLFAPKPANELKQDLEGDSYFQDDLYLDQSDVEDREKKPLGVGKRATKHRERRLWLDLDAIDTTWMESNVHAIRHNYFNLNPVLLEDLRELILTGRRAAERSLLLHREGNIYSYCQAPACVVNE